MADLATQLAKRRAINHARQEGKWYSVNRKKPEPKARQHNEAPADSRADLILAFLAEHGPNRYLAIRNATHIASNSMGSIMEKLSDSGQIVRSGPRRAYLYSIPGDDPAVEPAHPERTAAHTYRAQCAIDELAEIDRQVAERRK